MCVGLSCPIYAYIIKFRTSNHKLAIEVGRYSKIDRSFRHCHLCDTNEIGDEYHLLYKCTNHDIVQIRNRFLQNMTLNYNMYYFIKLLKNVKDYRIGVRLGKFLKCSKIV